MMRRILSLLLLLSAFNLLPAKAANTPKAPDFAYPQTVIADSEKLLDKALNNNDSQGIVDALVRISLAKCIISPDSIPAVIQRIEAIEAKTEEPVTDALLNLLLARIYSDYFSQNSFTLSDRISLADPGNDITLWSGDNFRNKIASLYAAATSNPDALKKARTADYSTVINADNTSLIFYPTLFDVACAMALNNDNWNNRHITILPRSAYLSTNISLPNTLNQNSKVAITIANNWVDNSSGAAHIAALLSRTKLIASYVCLIDANRDYDNLDEIYIQLYKNNINNPYSVELLLACQQYIFGDSTFISIYNLLSDFISKNPDYFRIDVIKSVHAGFEQQAFSIVFPEQIAPGVPFNISVKLTNLKHLPLSIYKVNNIDLGNPRYCLADCDPLPIDKLIASTDGDIPFVNSVEIPVKIDNYGHYIIIPDSINGSKPNADSYYDAISCSSLAIYNVNANDKTTVHVVDAISGAPISNANVELYTSTQRNNYDTSNLFNSAITNSKGCVVFNNTPIDMWRSVRATRGDDKYGMRVIDYIKNYPSETDYSAIVNTDLPIYHPGDSVQFVAVVYSSLKDINSPLLNDSCRAILVNTNNEKLDTLNLITDRFGRISGSFHIPNEGLTGKWRVSVYSQHSSKSIGKGYFTVSDYKLPSFEVTTEKPVFNPNDSSFTISGKAMAYSGFPIQNARVIANFSSLGQNFWRNYVSQPFHSDTISTNADGFFNVKLPRSVILNAPASNGGFNVEFMVTSTAGENQSASRKFFILGYKQIQWYYGPLLQLEATEKVKLPISFINPAGEPIDASLSLSLYNDNVHYSATALLSNGSCFADFSNIPSGSYNLDISCDTDSVPPLINVSSLSVYNPNINYYPTDLLIWYSSKDYNADPVSRRAKINFGLSADNPHILLTVVNQKQLLQQRWLKCRKGANSIEIAVPDSLEYVKVYLSTISNLEHNNAFFTVNCTPPDKSLKIHVDHLRNNVTPLDEETITLHVTNADGSPADAAVILDIYNKAIDALQPLSWDFSIRNYSSRDIDINTLEFGTSFISTRPNFRFKFQYLNTYPPTLNLYGKQFLAPIISDFGSIKLARTSAVDNKIEVESDENHVYTSVIMTDMKTDKKLAQFRPAEVPLALFSPLLSTNADGSLSITYRVPDANTTWLVKALAYNSRLATANFDADVIAAKPVMIQPNLPRFLRTGDKTEIASIVVNNTDSVQSVNVTLQIIDNGTARATLQKSISLTPNSSQSVSFPVDAPNTEGALLLLVKASTQNYSDGVKSLLPILPSSQPVIDTATFYLSPDSLHYTQLLPTPSPDSQITLSFCENPTWEVVSALPALRSDNANTATGAAAQLFSAAVSAYVMELNPNIQPALKEWLDSSDASQQLLSQLNTNPELKQLMLAATPWVQQAQSDEQRIQQLALLFDRDQTTSAINSAVATLKKLERDGGWAWATYSDQPSQWATLLVLNNLAQLRQLGCYPAHIDDSMIARAWEYIDADIAKLYNENPKADFTFYTYVRSLFPEIELPTNALKAYNASVQNLVKNWKSLPTAQKAAAALTLYRNKYPSLAKEILNSIRQFASSTPQLGMWWDSLQASSWHTLSQVGQTAFLLQAFNTIDPGCHEIDQIRQWLIINKTAQNWGNSNDASACIAAILQCGSQWLSQPGNTTISIDNNPITPDKIDSLTGAYVVNITSAGNRLDISRTVNNPAWGAVITRSTQLMHQIEAHSSAELSVEKQILTNTDNGWIPTDTLTIGDVTRVRLIIDAARDIDYITIVDNRPAALEPTIQTPRYIYSEGIPFYLENRDDRTNIFISRLPKGRYILEYETNANSTGSFASGIATIQSQYTPTISAHSSGSLLHILNRN